MVYQTLKLNQVSLYWTVTSCKSAKETRTPASCRSPSLSALFVCLFVYSSLAYQFCISFRSSESKTILSIKAVLLHCCSAPSIYESNLWETVNNINRGLWFRQLSSNWTVTKDQDWPWGSKPHKADSCYITNYTKEQ